MKNIIRTLIISTLFTTTLFAQDIDIHESVRLPKGAAARLGNGHIYAMQYTEDGTRLAIATSIGVWLNDATNFKKDNKLHLMNVVFSPDSKLIAVVDNSASIRLWDVKTAELMRTIDAKSFGVVAVAFSPNGKVLAVGKQYGEVQLIDVETGNLLQQFTGHLKMVTRLAFTPDGSKLVSQCNGGILYVWTAK